jgi:DNA ligase-1
MRSLDEIYERMDDQPFVAEFKYDGQRAQIHATVENGRVSRFKVFSRHLEDMTTKVSLISSTFKLYMRLISS